MKFVAIIAFFASFVASQDCTAAGVAAVIAENGKDAGNCTSPSMTSGSQCQPTCNNGYTPSGPRTCKNGVLSPVTCEAVICTTPTGALNGKNVEEDLLPSIDRKKASFNVVLKCKEGFAGTPPRATACEPSGDYKVSAETCTAAGQTTDQKTTPTTTPISSARVATATPPVVILLATATYHLM